MYIKKLLGYLFGYLCISVEGYYIERFINICMNKKIFLWNMKRDRDTILNCRIYIHDFKRIISIAKQTKCRIKIEKKRGVPFILNKYKKRKIFAVSCLCVILIILGLSNFIWDIEVSSDEAIEISGTKATIKIVKAEEKPDIINEEDYCNIVATKDGIIQKVNAVNGTPLVKEGDVVTKGSILIAGWLEGKYTGVRYVHSNGEVQAKVWYSGNEKIYLNTEKNERTGECETGYSVKINKFKINFKKGVPKFKFYDTITQTDKIKLFSNFYLPIEIEKNMHYEIEKVQVNYTVEEAEKEALKSAREKAYEQIENKDNIVNEIVKTSQNTDCVEVQVIEEVLENIGTKEKIVF